jgi:hypothetical protein
MRNFNDEERRLSSDKDNDTQISETFLTPVDRSRSVSRRVHCHVICPSSAELRDVGET